MPFAPPLCDEKKPLIFHVWPSLTGKRWAVIFGTNKSNLLQQKKMSTTFSNEVLCHSEIKLVFYLYMLKKNNNKVSKRYDATTCCKKWQTARNPNLAFCKDVCIVSFLGEVQEKIIFSHSRLYCSVYSIVFFKHT